MRPFPDTDRWDYRSAVDGLPDWALLRDGDRGNGLWAVVLHGHGSTGDQIFTRPDIQPWQRHIAARGMGLLSPHLRGNSWMSPAAVSDLHDLLNRVRETRGAKRFVFCSGSMGGTANLIYAVNHPEDVAGIVALCPATDLASYYDWAVRGTLPVLKEITDAIRAAYGGDPASRPGVYAEHSALKRADRLTMPVFMVHGDADALIPVEQSRQLVQKLRACAATVDYTELAGGDHDAPLEKFGPALDTVLNHLQPEGLTR